jgi:hypothetical protein
MPAVRAFPMSETYSGRARLLRHRGAGGLIWVKNASNRDFALFAGLPVGNPLVAEKQDLRNSSSPARIGPE